MNPWVHGSWLHDMRRTYLETGVEYSHADVQAIIEHPPATCRCGAIVHFKPAVGAYVCRDCGAINGHIDRRARP